MMAPLAAGPFVALPSWVTTAAGYIVAGLTCIAIGYAVGSALMLLFAAGQKRERTRRRMQSERLERRRRGLRSSYLAALMLLLLASTAAGAEPSWLAVQRVQLALERLPTTPEDRASPSRAAELETLARSIAAASVKAPRPPIEWASLLVAIGSHESNFAGRILRSECRRHECDSYRGSDGLIYFRARGWGQVHANALNRVLWERAWQDVGAQTELVDLQLRRAYYTCARSGVPWAAATLNAYAGLRCGAKWPGLDKRLATYAAAAKVMP
jgi:hypothetical protein